MKEVWKDIEGFEDRYQVSNLGKVRSLDRITTNILGRKKRYKGRILKQKINGSGYLTKGFEILNTRDRKYYMVHRLVAQAFIPNPENKPQVNHIDGDKTNNCVDNLEWSTVQENIDHSVKNGLHPIGERVGNAKITKRDVIGIKTHLKYEFSIKTIAEIYDVSLDIVRRIEKGKTWKHIKI